MTDSKDSKPSNLKPNRPSKRIIVETPKSTIIQTASSTDILLADAKAILASELSRYRKKVQTGLSLDLKEARVVQGYLSELTKMQREEREEARNQDLSNLTNEELFEIAARLLGTQQAKLPQD